MPPAPERLFARMPAITMITRLNATRMPMRVVCRGCQKQFSLRDENVGEYFRCRACGKLSPVAQTEMAEPIETWPAATRPALPTVKPAARVSSLAPGASPTEVRWQIPCQQCGRRHKVRADLAGKQFRCKGCGAFSPIAPPNEATDDDDEILVAMPIAAGPILPTAQVVFDDDAGRLSPPFASLPAMPVSTIRLAPPAAKPTIAPPKKKKKRKRKNPFLRFVAAALLGSLKGLFGLVCALLGLAIVGWALYSLVGKDEHFWGRGTFRALILGGAFVGTGIRWLLSRPFSDD